MSTLTEIGDFLEQAAIGIQAPNAGYNLFLGQMPDSPDTAIAVYEYPGNAPEYVQNSYAPIAERPQIQVVTRAQTYADAKALADAAWSALSPVTNAILGGTKYRSIRPNSSPAFMKRDTNDRALIFFNASVDKEVSLAAVS